MTAEIHWADVGFRRAEVASMTGRASMRIIALIAISTVAMALSAQASIAAPRSARPPPAPAGIAELPGRYFSDATGTLLDIDRCGAAWCGIRLNEDSTCGDLALRFTAQEGPDGATRVLGSFDRRAGADRHAVKGSLHHRLSDGTATLSLVGEPGDRLGFIRRMYTFYDALARVGDPACRHADATS
jgi:hypothetical protein